MSDSVLTTITGIGVAAVGGLAGFWFKMLLDRRNFRTDAAKVFIKIVEAEIHAIQQGHTMIYENSRPSLHDIRAAAHAYLGAIGLFERKRLRSVLAEYEDQAHHGFPDGAYGARYKNDFETLGILQHVTSLIRYF